MMGLLRIGMLSCARAISACGAAFLPCASPGVGDAAFTISAPQLNNACLLSTGIEGGFHGRLSSYVERLGHGSRDARSAVRRAADGVRRHLSHAGEPSRGYGVLRLRGVRDSRRASGRAHRAAKTGRQGVRHVLRVRARRGGGGLRRLAVLGARGREGAAQRHVPAHQGVARRALRQDLPVLQRGRYVRGRDDVRRQEEGL